MENNNNKTKPSKEEVKAAIAAKMEDIAKNKIVTKC